MPWPQQRRLLGTKVPRLDGPEESTRRARHAFDIHRPGMLHAKILRCPHARARVRSIDTTAAHKVPGFRAIYVFDAFPLASVRPDTQRFAPLTGNAITGPGTELFYAGSEVLAVACDTEEHCDDALRAVRVDYDGLPFPGQAKDGLRRPNQT